MVLEDKPRSYKNLAASETVDVKTVSPPFKMVGGKIVYAKHDGKKWIW